MYVWAVCAAATGATMRLRADDRRRRDARRRPPSAFRCSRSGAAAGRRGVADGRARCHTLRRRGGRTQEGWRGRARRFDGGEASATVWPTAAEAGGGGRQSRLRQHPLHCPGRRDPHPPPRPGRPVAAEEGGFLTPDSILTPAGVAVGRPPLFARPHHIHPGPPSAAPSFVPDAVARPSRRSCARGRGREVESSLEEEVSCGVKS